MSSQKRPSATTNKWRSQNAEKVTHIKGRLLKQELGPFELRKAFAPRGSEFFPLRVVPKETLGDLLECVLFS